MALICFIVAYAIIILVNKGFQFAALVSGG